MRRSYNQRHLQLRRGGLMSRIIFPVLSADDVEVRIASIKKDGKGASLVLYKDARCDMRILDKVVGAENWQSKYYECKGTLFCSVGIRINDEWIWKDDAGSESNVEKEKGEASDAYKRACFKWGIGRELYTTPFIWDSNGDKYSKYLLDVLEVNADHQIFHIIILNTTNKTKVFEWYNKNLDDTSPDDKKVVPEPHRSQMPQPADKPQLTPSHPRWNEAKNKLNTGNTTIKIIKKSFNISPEHEKALLGGATRA